jgi:hypothetical protein
MLRAAFTSRSWVAPQQHRHSRMFSGNSSRTAPHSELTGAAAMVIWGTPCSAASRPTCSSLGWRLSADKIAHPLDVPGDVDDEARTAA